MIGCAFVLHIASPFINIEPKDENEYIKPEFDGTLRALKQIIAYLKTQIKGNFWVVLIL
jgi:hypothetical protein|tara:strand:+ start:456 stop:632 length:177 start_codon:yes stop_codon:yes gene_type:complete